MPIGRFLTHHVTIVRNVAVLDGSDPSLDDYGQPVRVEQTLAVEVPASIQPKSERELAAISQAGVATSDHTIYLYPRDLSTADRIIHFADACPMSPDLPDAEYELTGVPSAAGMAHHLEVDARLIGSPIAAVAVAAVGGGS